MIQWFYDSKSQGTAKQGCFPLEPIAEPQINHIYVNLYICKKKYKYLSLSLSLSIYLYTHTHIHTVPPTKNPRLIFTFVPTEMWLSPGFNLPPGKEEAKEGSWSSLTQNGHVLDKAGALTSGHCRVILVLSSSFLPYYSWVYFTIDGPVWFP